MFVRSCNCVGQSIKGAINRSSTRGRYYSARALFNNPPSYLEDLQLTLKTCFIVLQVWNQNKRRVLKFYVYPHVICTSGYELYPPPARGAPSTTSPGLSRNRRPNFISECVLIYTDVLNIRAVPPPTWRRPSVRPSVCMHALNWPTCCGFMVMSGQMLVIFYFNLLNDSRRM